MTPAWKHKQKAQEAYRKSLLSRQAKKAAQVNDCWQPGVQMQDSLRGANAQARDTVRWQVEHNLRDAPGSRQNKRRKMQ